MNLLEELEKLRRHHRECEDCWYSCPKSEEGSCDDMVGKDCNCGADAHNARLDSVIAEAKALLAAAGGEQDKICATCRFCWTDYDGFSWCNSPDSQVGKIRQPDTFGCIHWQQAPARKNSEGEQG